jgi:YHS domain-containing protein
MNGRTRFPGQVLMIAGVVLAALAGLVVFSGCEKETPTAQEQMQQMPMHEHAAADQPKAEAVVVEQTTCPVMGGAINKAIFVEYQGKKVYFCCAGCPEVFKANPEKYLAKLPQFQK